MKAVPLQQRLRVLQVEVLKLEHGLRLAWGPTYERRHAALLCVPKKQKSSVLLVALNGEQASHLGPALRHRCHKLRRHTCAHFSEGTPCIQQPSSVTRSSSSRASPRRGAHSSLRPSRAPDAGPGITWRRVDVRVSKLTMHSVPASGTWNSLRISGTSSGLRVEILGQASTCTPSLSR